MTILAQAADTTSATSVATMTGDWTVNILINNYSGGAPVNIGVAIVKNGNSLANATWIIGPTWPLTTREEKGGIPLDDGDQVYYQASASGTNISIVGIARP